jgi:hypothetical protein
MQEIPAGNPAGNEEKRLSDGSSACGARILDMAEAAGRQIV